MRIISGHYRGRVIQAPPGRDTRPTAACVKESLFAILQSRMEGARVLDLFCGSGAMSLEAISRGAKHAVLIDVDAIAVRTAKNNIQMLQAADACEVYRNDFVRACALLKQRKLVFDIVFIDPPYQSGYYKQAVEMVFSGLNAKGCVAVLEHASDIVLELPRGVQMIDSRQYGRRSVSFVEKDDALE